MPPIAERVAAGEIDWPRLANYFEERSRTILGENQLIQNRWNSFETKLEEQGYSPQEKELILTAAKIALVGHQENSIEGRQHRKEERDEKGNPLPYFIHPLRVAAQIVAKNLDHITVAAALLHDVPEDVSLEIDHLGIKISDLPEEADPNILSWFDVIPGLLSSYSPDPEEKDVKVLTEIVRLDTKTKDPTKVSPPKGIFGRIVKKAMADYYQGEGQIKEEEEKKIALMVADLERLFTALLKDPELIRALLVKITDVVDNTRDLRSNGKVVSPYKIIRAVLLANTAFWLGDFPSFATIYNHLGNRINPATIKPRLNNHRQNLIDKPSPPPITHLDLNSLITNLSSKRTVLVLPRLPRMMGTSSLPTSIVIASFKGEKPLISHQGSFVTKNLKLKILANTYPREGYYFFGFLFRLGREGYLLKTGQEHAVIIIDDNQKPWLIDHFDRQNPTPLETIPEAALFTRPPFKDDVEDEVEKNALAYHIASLIGFLYYPNLSNITGNLSFMVNFGSRWCFVPRNIKLARLRKLFGGEIRINGTPLREIPNHPYISLADHLKEEGQRSLSRQPIFVRIT